MTRIAEAHSAILVTSVCAPALDLREHASFQALEDTGGAGTAVARLCGVARSSGCGEGTAMELVSRFTEEGRNEGRLHPRRRCHLRLERPEAGPAAVKDIGLGGLRMLTSGLQRGEVEEALLHIPGSNSPCDVRYEVVHAGDDGVVGARFRGMTASTRLRLTDYVDHVRSVELLKRLQARLGVVGLSNLKPLGNPDATRLLIERLAEDRATLRVWSDPRQPAFDAHLVEARDGHITLDLEGGDSLRAFDEVVFAIDEGEVVYLADTTVADPAERGAVIVMPERLYRPERRRDLRDTVSERGVAELHTSLGGRSVRLVVLEESGGGLSIIVPPRQAAQIIVGDRWEGVMVRPSGATVPLTATVAHLAPFDDPSDKPAAPRVRVGLNRLIDRMDVAVTPLDFEDAARAKAHKGLSRTVRRAKDAARSTLGPAPPQSEVVRFANRHGETIVGLVLRSATPRQDAMESLVVIPPAYGRKKEDTAGLALTILQTFRKAGAAVTVLRYDATHAVGESERHVLHDDDPDYHNAGYTLTRGVSDLDDVIEWMRGRHPLGAGPVGIVSFSLSATVARRVVADDEGRRIRSWVAPCGAADTRDLVRNSTGGVDYLEDNRRGRRWGLRQVVGHVMDVESFCGDAWQAGMADLTDARADMARIEIPVTWICGSFDYWVNVNRVADMLTVKGPAGASQRELITVPTGHIVRNSLEALETFKVIAGRLGRDLLGRETAAVAPSTREMLALSKAERDRLRRPEFEPRTYWRRYLLGDGDNPLGFDVISLTSEYGDLLDRQLEALDVQAGDRVIDLGAGTGNLSEALLGSLNGASARRVSELNLVDLVPDALATARAKLERVQALDQRLRAKVWCHAYDLSAVDPPRGAALPFGDAAVDRVVASLLLSYLPAPGALLRDVRRVLRPGGRVVISSFLPDTDLSGPLKRLLGRIHHARSTGEPVGPWRADDVLDAVRSYINDAAKLLDLACDGVFRFYDEAALASLLREAGFRDVRTASAFGQPGQAVIAWADRPGG